MVRFLIIYSLTILSLSCRNQDKDKVFFDFSEKGEYIYPCDSLISDQNGILKNLNGDQYFPSYFSFKKGDSVYTEYTGFDYLVNECDSIKPNNFMFFVNWFFTPNSYLELGEPILYNFYLSKDIYRFYWNRAFHPMKIFILTKENRNVLLTVHHFKYDMTQGYPLNIIDYTTTKEVGLKEWNEFERLMQQADFWNLPIDLKTEDGDDGATWLLEGHKENQYRFIERWCPDYSNIELYNCGKFLIKLDDPTINEKDIY